MRAKRMAATSAGLLLTAGLSVTQTSAAQAAEAAAPCHGTYTIVVGGTGSSWNNDGFTGNIQQHVGYPTQIPNGASARAGVNELNRLVRDQRAACPNQHVKMGVTPWVPRSCTPGSPRAGRPSTRSTPSSSRTPSARAAPAPTGERCRSAVSSAPRSPVPTGSSATYRSRRSATGTTSATSPCGIWTYPHNHINNYPNDFNMDHHNNSANEQWYNGAWHPASW